MRPYKVNFELSAAGFAELNSQVRRKCGMALYGRILAAFKCKFRIFFSLVCQIFNVKATLRMCKLRFMYVSWYVFASFLYLQVLTLSCLWKCLTSVRTTRPRQFDRSQEHCMLYPKRHANKLFFIRIVSLASLSTSLIFEGLIVFGHICAAFWSSLMIWIRRD